MVDSRTVRVIVESYQAFDGQGAPIQLISLFA
jgi:hypothetical protein